MKKLASMLSIALFFVAFTSAAFSAQILLKGKVTDSYTGEPIGVTMRFETSDGKVFKIKSDPVSGEYSQLFNSSTEYEVTFIHKEIVRKTESFKTEDANAYKEFKRDFNVQKLTKGLVFMDLNVFQKGNSNFESTFAAKLEEINEIMKFNRNVKFNFVVSLNDLSEKERASKAALLEQRKTALEEKVNSLGKKNARRINIKTESSCDKAKNNMAVVVKSIKSVLK